PGRGLIAGLSTVTALAVIAAGALGYLYATKDDSGTGPGGGLATDGKTMRQAWKSPAPGARIDMLGTWTAPGRTIAGDKSALVAYDAGTGAEIGRFTPPTGEFCGMAAHSSDGIGLAMYGPKDACDTTVALDLATMRSLWDKKSKTAATGDKYRSVETDSGPGTAVLSTSTGVAAFGLKDGVQKWSWNFDRSTTSTTDDPEVDALRIDGGTVLVELGQYTKNTPAQVVALDVGDGRRKWQTTIPVTDSGYSTVYLVNAEPAVLEIQRNGSYYLQSLGDQGQLRAEIPLRGPDGTLRAYDTRSAAYSSDFGAAPQYNVVIAKDTLFATTVKRDQPAGQAVRLVAFDLTNGKARWSTALGADLYNADVVGTDDTAVFVLGRGLPGTPGKLVAVKRQDGNVRGARAVDGKDFLSADDRAGWSLADQRLTAFAWTAYPEVPALVTLA
ncbi:MAG: PQQ-binding-like beta-propeller repeat protein, partial [Streptomycetaceae bacterium]|nr:PQQ-binding-like beta-propeller repeat protein [Streptomycetaceae bacterium]